MCKNDLGRKADVLLTDETGLYGIVLDTINENGTLEFLAGDRRYIINPASPSVISIEFSKK